jgi:multisubunit Na+/H+ antiporter MnhG subunit
LEKKKLAKLLLSAILNEKCSAIKDGKSINLSRLKDFYLRNYQFNEGNIFASILDLAFILIFSAWQQLYFKKIYSD